MFTGAPEGIEAPSRRGRDEWTASAVKCLLLYRHARLQLLFVVRGLQRVGDLPRDRQRFVQRKAGLPDPPILSVPPVPPVPPVQPIDVRDVGMIERGEQLRLAFESSQPIAIGGEGFRKDLQRDVALQLRVAAR